MIVPLVYCCSSNQQIESLQQPRTRIFSGLHDADVIRTTPLDVERTPKVIVLRVDGLGQVCHVALCAIDDHRATTQRHEGGRLPAWRWPRDPRLAAAPQIVPTFVAQPRTTRLFFVALETMRGAHRIL